MSTEDLPVLDADSRHQKWPPDINTSEPSVARCYDYMLGGKDNFAVDRELGDKAVELVPEMPQVCRDNRELLIRVVRYMSRVGIDQFLDIGSGLPTMENTHQAAQRLNPDASVVYVDNDPIVLAHGRAILEENPHTTVLDADMRDADAVFSAKPCRDLLASDRPVGLLLLAIIHHLNDEEDPAGMVRAYLDRLPSGSMVAISHFYTPVEELQELDAEIGQELFDKASRTERLLMREGAGTGRFRTRAELAALFGDTEFIEPGLTHPPLWWPDGPPPYLGADQRLLLCGVARKP